MRKLISDILNQDSEIEVVDTAKNGLEAIEKTRTLRPDVITLDVRMPDISGLDVLDEVMEKFPTPVVMISAYTKEGAKESILAYEYGAVEVIAKPSGEVSMNIREIKDQIITAVKNASIVDVQKLIKKRIKKISKIIKQSNKEIVIIGASTGGPLAVAQIMQSLPADFPVPIIIVQHMPGKFTPVFAQRLDKKSYLKVKEAGKYETLEKGTAYVIPGEYNPKIMKKENDFIVRLVRKKPKELCSIDSALKSASESYKEKVIAVVLTGMGNDGRKGAELLKQQGSSVIVQDEKTSVVFGMPKEIIEDKNADFILPLEQINEKIAELLYKKN